MHLVFDVRCDLSITIPTAGDHEPTFVSLTAFSAFSPSKGFKCDREGGKYLPFDKNKHLHSSHGLDYDSFDSTCISSSLHPLPVRILIQLCSYDASKLLSTTKPYKDGNCSHRFIIHLPEAYISVFRIPIQNERAFESIGRLNGRLPHRISSVSRQADA